MTAMPDLKVKQRRWPLFLIASPAAVAVWSGWVALGAMCGFGPVNLLPGVGRGFTLNTAITLPVGVEAYGAYALGAWLTGRATGRALTFARRSAIGSLALGMAGQVIYHLLAAAHRTRAPWPVTVLVACMPVVTLGFGAALTHLLNGTAEATAGVPETVPADSPELAPWPRPAPVLELATDERRSAAADDYASAVRGDSAPVPAAVAEVAPKAPAGAPRSASRRRRTGTPRATDEELAELAMPLFGSSEEVTKYRVIKAVREARGIGIGDDRAGRVLELARREHAARRGANVTPMKRDRA